MDRHQKVPRQWKKFMTSGKNKELVKFFFTNYACPKRTKTLCTSIEVEILNSKWKHKSRSRNILNPCRNIKIEVKIYLKQSRNIEVVARG